MWSAAAFLLLVLQTSLSSAVESDGVCRFGRALNGLPTTEAEAIQCATEADCPYGYACTVSSYAKLQTITVCCPRMAVWTWVPPHPTQPVPAPRPPPPTANPPRKPLRLCSFGRPLGALPTSEDEAIQCSTNKDCPTGYSCTVGGPYLQLATIAMCCPNRPPRPLPTTVTTSAIRRPIPNRTYDDRCHAEPSKSPCWQAGRARIGWYFNMTTQCCAAFVYSQCQIQTKRPFKTRVDCESTCLWHQPVPTEPEPLIPRPLPLPPRPPAPPILPRATTSTTTTTTSCPETEPAVAAEINYFQEPVEGYAKCPHRTPCSMANPCNAGSFCPAHPNAKCIQSYCQGCLAEFHLNGRRVNCSTIAESDQKVGRCPGLTDGFIVCDPQFYAQRPEPVLCSADAECPLSQKCCPDACYQGVHKTCAWPVL